VSKSGSLTGSELARPLLTRLLIVRHLLHQARSAAHAPPPRDAVAVLHSHDAVELLLLVAAEHCRLDVQPNSGFMAYMEALAPVLGSSHHKTALRRLNNARREFKHRGLMPSGVDVVELVAVAADFIGDAFKQVFGSDLEGVSLIRAVRHDRVRRHLEAAEEFARARRFGHALKELSQAFDLAIAKSRAASFGERRGILGASINFSSYASGEDVEELASEVESFADDVQSAIHEIDTVLGTLAMGLEYARYLSIRRTWPRRIGRDDETQWVGSPEDWTRRSFEESLEFVLDSVLQLEGSGLLLEAGPEENLARTEPTLGV